MASDPITAVANALAQAGALAQPWVEDRIRQKHEREHQDRMQEWVSILASPPDGRADRVHAFVMRVLARAGAPAAGVGANIAVPLDVLNALISELSEGIKKDGLINNLQFRKP